MVEITGLALWILAYTFESIADAQKINSLKKWLPKAKNVKYVLKAYGNTAATPTILGSGWCGTPFVLLASFLVCLDGRGTPIDLGGLGSSATFCLPFNVLLLGLFDRRCPL